MKKWISRRNFLKAAGISAVAAGLTACGGSSNSTTTGSSAAASGATAANNEMPKVVMYYPLSSVQPDQEKVAKAIHDYVAEKKGIDLQLEVVPSSSYNNQLNLVMAGSEQVDIALVWGTMVSSCVAKGALLPLDDLLDEYGTDIQECLGDYLQAGKVSGVAYQVPVNRSLFYQGGIVVRTDILEKYGIDPATIKSTDDLDGMFETIHAGEPDMAMMRLEGSGTFVYADYDPLGDTFGVLLNYGQDDEISDLFSSDKFRAECEKHREWFKKGWIASDILTTTDGAAEQIKAGKLLGFYGTVGPGTAQDKTNQCGRDMTVIPLNTVFSYTTKVNSFGWSLLNNSKNPEAAMQVLDMVYSDPNFLNMLDWGLEGVH